MRAGPAARWALIVAAPLLLAAADPPGDLTGCRDGPGADAPDLVEARGEIVEEGTSARWTLTFAEPLEVPDRDGRPFRVDVAIRDPDVPALSFAYFRDVNRIVRIDATVEHPTRILLLAEGGTNVFNPPLVDGPTMTIQVPGRILSADEDLTGTSPGLGSLGWTVIVRKGGTCDFLGDGRPTQRMVPGRETPPPPPRVEADTGGWWYLLVVAVTFAVGAFA